MHKKYTPEQLEYIREQAMVYQCACPAQVCVVINAMVKLYDYQQNCLNAGDTNDKVHKTIATSAETCYRELENCLTDVLMFEGWDMETLTMPENLHKQLLDSLS